MKIKKITRNIAVEHTWDISTNNETYILSNGCISHNSSSQIANATNGIEPPRSLISYKQSKDGVLTQVVPEYRKLKNKYDLLWDQKSPIGYLKLTAILQKYIDQGISTNISYNPKFFDKEEIPMSVMLQDILLAYKWGVKQIYYHNTHDGQGEMDIDKVIEEESECSSCSI